MHNNTRSERGMSLVEATIILMVLAILTAVLAPSMTDYINDARHTKAKEDTEALGTSIVRMLRGTSKPFLQIAVGASYTSDNRVDLLVSEGNTPTESDTSKGTPANALGYLVEADVDWDDPTSQAGVELATDHLVTNVAGYVDVTYPAAGGPQAGLGWRGGYLSGTTGPDPWGNRYGCTTAWLSPGSDNTSAFAGTNRDAFCLSAGANGDANTDMDGNGDGVIVGLDDVIYVFQGNTR